MQVGGAYVDLIPNRPDEVLSMPKLLYPMVSQAHTHHDAAEEHCVDISLISAVPRSGFALSCKKGTEP